MNAGIINLVIKTMNYKLILLYINYCRMKTTQLVLARFLPGIRTFTFMVFIKALYRKDAQGI